MNISIKQTLDPDCPCDVLILPMTEDSGLRHNDIPDSAASIANRIFPSDFKGKKNETMLIPAPEDMKPKRLLFVGLGKTDDISAETLRQAGGKAVAALKDTDVKKAAAALSFASSIDLSASDFLEGVLLGAYSFDRYKSEKKVSGLRELLLVAARSKKLDEEIEWTKAVSNATVFVRDLVNTPANDMSPAELASAAESLKGKKTSVKILDRKDIEKLGMGSYLAVAKGSHAAPNFITLQYKGSREKPIVLVGKAITFDSGGISLKPADGMEKMKYDMAGGAAVLGVIKAVSEASLPVHVVGLIPATENLPGGSATKPGDVVKAMSGKTVEIINTDAEGRLILADALTYAKRFDPRAVVDIATLTGACSIALGNEAMAVMGSSREVLEKLKAASAAVSEKVWEMPLFEEYKDYIKSDIADIKNSGGRTGSLVTSAYFLKEFTDDMAWAHLDIASTAWVEKDKPYIPKGASGIGVRLLSEFVRNFI